MRVLLIILTACGFVGATNLDSLLLKSHTMRIEAERGPGYVKFLGVPTTTLRPLDRTRIHLTPPDSLFGSPESRRITALEAKVDKMSAIIEEQQAHAEANTKSMDGTVKLVEALAGLLGAVLALLQFFRGKKAKEA